MKRVVAVAWLGAALLALPGTAPAEDAGPGPRVQSPADARTSVPEPGTYELPPIAKVRDHWLLDSHGERDRLLGLAPGQLALVALVYTSCPAACPAALAVLQEVDRALGADPALQKGVRIVAVSFDPQNDTPEKMAELRERFAPVSDWRFLTAPDAEAIRPVLQDFDQDALRLVVAAKESRGEIGTPLVRHVLKVFLVDDAGQIRNIYSTGLFSRELVLADLRTLQPEGGLAAVPRP